MLITLGFSGFLAKTGIRKIASGNHTAHPQLRTYGASRPSALTFPRQVRRVPRPHCKTHSPPLQGFAAFGLDGAFGTPGTNETSFMSERLDIFVPLLSLPLAFNRKTT